MKILLLFCLLNLIYLCKGERNSRNLFTDFLKNFLPGFNRNYKNNQVTYDDCECGLSGVRTARVVNGSDAKPDAVPWNAALFSQSSRQQFCSATLINSRWLITAYHCAMEQTTSSFRILLGASRLNENQVAHASFYTNLKDQSIAKKLERENKRKILETLYQLDSTGNKSFLFDLSSLNPFSLDSVNIYRAKRIILNKEFEKSFFKNDVALIELEQDVKFTDHIRPICLFNRSMIENGYQPNINAPEINNSMINNIINKFDQEDLNVNNNLMVNDFVNEERWLMHQQFSAYGFGRIGFNKRGSSKLQTLTFKYETVEKCRNKWLTKIPLYGDLIDETHICVFNKYSTICHGDSGTGLILKGNQFSSTNVINGKARRPNKMIIDDNLTKRKAKSYLVGVASAGWYCEPDVPPLFTRLTSQLDFIYSNINSGYWCSR